MVTLYVHIGMSKTGSSALQHAIAASSGRLAELGLEYPEVGRDGVNHQPLALELIRGSGPAHWPRLREHLASTDRDQVISAEAFEGLRPNVLREAVGGAAEVKVIFYVRPTVDRMPSFYSQNTKYGLNLSDFDTFFGAQHVERDGHWRYATFARTWVDAFPSRVRVRSLDREALTGGDLAADFLDACDRDPASAADLASTSARDADNMSPGWKLIETLRGFHRDVVDPNSSPLDRMHDLVLWPYLERAFTIGLRVADEMGWTERRPYLSAEQYELLSQNYAEDRAEIAQLDIDQRLTEPAHDPVAFIRDEMPCPELVPDAERGRFLARLAPELVRIQLRLLRQAKVD